MGAIVNLCDDDEDESPRPHIPSQQASTVERPRKRNLGCVADGGVPCKQNREARASPNIPVDAGTPQDPPDACQDHRLQKAMSPMPVPENRIVPRQISNQDKVAARRAVLERKAAEKKAAKEAQVHTQEEERHPSLSTKMSPLPDVEDKKRQKRQQAAAKKATKEFEKAEKARQKEAEKAEKAKQKEETKTAKAAEKRARGTNADQEVTVSLDTSIAKTKTKHTILDALEAHDVKFTHEVEAGKLPGWSTITWKRNNSSMVAPGGASSVPYVMVVLDAAESQSLLGSDTAVKSLLDSIISVYGQVSVSLLLIGLQRTLVTQDRRDHTHAVRSGDASAASGAKKNLCLLRLLALHFRHEGITYRDCHDAEQAAEHVVGITAAIAKQAYKGGHDMLTAFAKKGGENRLAGTAATYNLNDQQLACAKALCALDWGPKQACSVAKQLHTFGAVVQQYDFDAQQACKSIAVMKTDTGRNVGPHAANKLRLFLCCEDPDAPFHE